MYTYFPKYKTGKLYIKTSCRNIFIAVNVTANFRTLSPAAVECLGQKNSGCSDLERIMTYHQIGPKLIRNVLQNLGCPKIILIQRKPLQKSQDLSPINCYQLSSQRFSRFSHKFSPPPDVFENLIQKS